MTVSEAVAIFSKIDPDDILKESGAFFQLPVLPEYLTSEMFTASCYRALGYAGMRDNWVMQNGAELTCLFTKGKEEGVASGAFSRDEVWKLLKDILLSPEDPKQRRSQKYPNYLFLAPIVPATAYFSNPIRLKKNANTVGGNPWNVELLFKALVAYCAKDKDDADALWHEFFTALSVSEDSNEDYFARIIEKVLEDCADAVKAKKPDLSLQFPGWKIRDNSIFSDGKFLIGKCNRRSFDGMSPLGEIRDSIRLILRQKGKFSRWQWMAMLDAQMRLSVVALVLWLLDLHHVANVAITEYVINGKEIPDGDAIEFFRSFYEKHHLTKVFPYGEGFAKAERKVVEQYARDYLRLAFILSLTKELPQSASEAIDWSSIPCFVDSLRKLQRLYSSSGNKNLFTEGFARMLEERVEDVNPRKSRLRHILEFFAVLRQRSVVASQSDFSRYDQSYWVRKKGNYYSAPFIVDIGSVACFTIVFCCARGKRVFPLKDLRLYLSKFYVSVKDDAHTDKFLLYLKGLGLTMDSPDAEDGLMVQNPFYSEEENEAR